MDDFYLSAEESQEPLHNLLRLYFRCIRQTNGLESGSINVQNPQEDVCEESHLIRTARILSKTSAILKKNRGKKRNHGSFHLN